MDKLEPLGTGVWDKNILAAVALDAPEVGNPIALAFVPNIAPRRRALPLKVLRLRPGETAA